MTTDRLASLSAAALALGVALAWPTSARASPRNPAVHFAQATEGEDLELRRRFVARLRDALQREFPCARITDAAEVAEILGRERECQLAGGDCGGVEAARRILCTTEYLVDARAFDSAVIGTTFSATLLYIRKPEATARAAAAGPRADAGATMERVVKDFLDRVAKYQLCPYTGTLRVDVTETVRRRAEENQAVYCNGQDQQYHRLETTERVTTTAWRLERTGKFGRRVATGALAHLTRDEQILSEEDPCHACSPTRKGAQLTNDKSVATTKIGKGEGAGGAALVDLSFQDDGTFHLGILSGAMEGEHTRKVEHHVEGSCGKAESEVKRDPPVTVKVPLANEQFGPFQGKPRDKQLQGKHRQVDKIDGGDRVIEIEWDLRRE